MPRLNGKVPKYKYRLHMASGQGVVTLDDRDFHCRPYSEPVSKAKAAYDQLIAHWPANVECPHHPTRGRDGSDRIDHS